MSDTGRTKKFVHNSAATALHQLVVLLSGFIMPRVVLQYYGSELNGLVSSINQFISYLSLVEAGLAAAAVYALYKPLADKDRGAISSVVSATKHFYIQSGWIFTGLIAVMALVYPMFVKTDKLNAVLVGVLVLALGSKSFIDFFTMAKYRVLLTADQRTYVVSNASTVYTLLHMLIVVVLSVLRVNIVVVYSASVITFIVRTLILMIYVRKNYPYIDYNAKPDRSALNKRWDALAQQLLGSLQTGAPVLIATVFTTLAEVSVYTVYNMVFSGVNGVLSIFNSGLSSGFGEVIARGEQKTLQHAYKDFEFAYHMLITVIYTTAAIMLLPFIKIYTAGVTDADYIRPIIAVLFALNGLLYNLKTPQGMIIIAAGMYKETRIRALIQGMIIVIAGVALAPFMGLVGILIASCLANIYRIIDVLIFVPKYITKLPVRVSVIRTVTTTALCTGMYLPFVFIDLPINGIISWVITAVCVVIGVTAVTCIVNYIIDKQQFSYIFSRVKNLFKH